MLRHSVAVDVWAMTGPAACWCAQVKSFAAAAVGPPVAGYPCPPYKLLILDEADSMTQVRTRAQLFWSNTGGGSLYGGQHHPTL